VYLLAFLVLLAIALAVLASPLLAVLIAIPLIVLFLLWRGWKRPKPGEEPGRAEAPGGSGSAREGPRFTGGEPRSGEGA
jgi:hypothetical protein